MPEEVNKRLAILELPWLIWKSIPTEHMGRTWPWITIQCPNAVNTPTEDFSKFGISTLCGDQGVEVIPGSKKPVRTLGNTDMAKPDYKYRSK